MRNGSIYRGQARTGIGEGPGRPVHHGEQFLAADPSLAGDGELLSAVRPWMTLDWRPADEQALGDKIEAWSYFPHGDLRLVVRLVAAGIYDRRAAYFAHARAFPASDMINAWDPGAYLGLSSAFEEPWKDERPSPPRSLGSPELVRPDQILAEPAVAGALLAHFYQGLVSGHPVVMAVPVSDFVAGGPLHALVSFARAALPLPLKSGCRIRVFTRLPELFLRHLRADLIVLPENEAANALAARRDATLLDRKGGRREGRDFSPEVGRYAEAVLQRVHRLPGGLLAFSGAIGEHFPKDRLPQDQELARVPVLYNLQAARSSPATLAQWIQTSLLKQVSERPTGLAWDRLLRPEDWHAIAFDDLAAILLTDATGDEATTLLRLAEEEARRPERGEVIAEERLRSRWNELNPADRPALLAKLLGAPERGRPLLTAETAARLSASLSLSALLTSGVMARLLVTELDSGLLQNRERDAGGLAAAAGRDLPTARVLVRATQAGVLSSEWVLAALKEEDGAVLRVAAAVLPYALGCLPWHSSLGALLQRLLAIPSLPQALGVDLEAALDRPDPLDKRETEAFFLLTELLVRSATPRAGQAVDRIWRLAATLAGSEERRRFLLRVADARWRSLESVRLLSRDGAGLVFSWVEDFTDLLLDSEEIRDQLPSELLLRLAGDRPEIAGWLDSRMRAEPRETVHVLLQAERWSLWRGGSSLPPEDLRLAALAWMASEHWRKRPTPQARLEDWKQAVEDLKVLDGSEIAHLFAGSPARPRWPWIPLFQDEQLRDLCRLARKDLGALAELAERLDLDRDLGYPIQGTLFEHVLAHADPALQEGLPPGVLSFLSLSPRGVLPPGQARILVERTRHRRDLATATLRTSIQKSLDRQPLEALQAAEWMLASINDPRIEQALRDWRKRSSPRSGEVEAILGRLLGTEAGSSKVDTGERLPLDPGIRALLEGDTTKGYWKKLEQAMRSYVSSSIPDHPVAKMVESLRGAYGELPQKEREALEKKGWRTFAGLTKAHNLLLRQPLLKGAPLPALELSVLLLPKIGVGGVAVRLLFLDSARVHASQEGWWDSLLAGVASSCRRQDGHPPARYETALHLILQVIPDLPVPEADAARGAIEERMKQLYCQRGWFVPQILDTYSEVGGGTV